MVRIGIRLVPLLSVAAVLAVLAVAGCGSGSSTPDSKIANALGLEQKGGAYEMAGNPFCTGEPLLIASAIVAAKHKVDITPVLIWAWVGATLGGITGWWAGRVLGRSVMTAPGPLHRLRLKAVERGEEVFRRLTVIAIMLAPSWVAGIHRAGTVVYLITNAVSAALWAVGIGLGAYYVGPAVLDVLADVGTATAIGLVVLVAVGIGFEVTRRRRAQA